MGVVRTRLRKDGMTVTAEELHIVAKANNADFEGVDVVEVGYAKLQFVRHV